MNEAQPTANEVESQLAAIADIGDDRIDIGRAALLLAALDRPSVEIGRYMEHLDALAEELGREHVPAEDRASALCAVLRDTFGYRGDEQTYDDDQNANLMRVIDRRKGLPVSLGILLIRAAGAAGWSVHGLSFPYHFLVRLDQDTERTVIDPFNGKVLSAVDMRALLKRFDSEADLKPAFYEPVSKRDVLIRLQNNLKSRAVQRRHFERASEIVERILLFAPARPELWRELGVLKVACGRVNEAVAAAERYASSAADEAQRHDAAALVQKIKSRLN